MAKQNKRHDIKSDILRTSTGREVKECMKKVYKSKAWEMGQDTMYLIIRAEVEQVEEVKELLSTKPKQSASSVAKAIKLKNKNVAYRIMKTLGKKAFKQKAHQASDTEKRIIAWGTLQGARN